MRFRTVDAGVYREQRVSTANMSLHVEQKHCKIAGFQVSREGFSNAKRWNKWTQGFTFRHIFIYSSIRMKHTHALEGIPKRQQVKIIDRRCGTDTPIPLFLYSFPN